MTYKDILIMAMCVILFSAAATERSTSGLMGVIFLAILLIIGEG